LGELEDDVRLWHHHIKAFEALKAAATQWRVVLVATPAGLGTRVLGLDYAGVKVALDMSGITLSPDEFRQLCVLEDAAAAAMTEASW
jgi:hypothetical protein